MVCGAAVNYKWKQKSLSSVFSPERDPDSLAWAWHAYKTHTHMRAFANYSVSLVLHY